MKAINIIGLLLIVITSTIGNRIAPGRYCAVFQRDTVWAFGQTKGAENDKHGFWVVLDKWNSSNNLGGVGHYVDNKKDGLWVGFNSDSLQTKILECPYQNDSLNGVSVFYNADGSMRAKINFQNDRIVYGSWPDDESSVVLGGKIITPLDFLFYEKEGEYVVVFNSWSNNITAINVVICCILLVLNVGKHCKKTNK